MWLWWINDYLYQVLGQSLGRMRPAVSTLRNYILRKNKWQVWVVLVVLRLLLCLVGENWLQEKQIVDIDYRENQDITL